MPNAASPPIAGSFPAAGPGSAQWNAQPGNAILYDSHDGNEGHRAEYYALFSQLIGTKRTGSLARALFSPRPVLVGALEASGALSRYLLLAVVRSLLGRKTAALLFRPLPTLAAASFKLRVKRWVLGLIRRLGLAQTLTIMPFALEPAFARIAASWIYDPQFWDLHFPERQPQHLAGSLASELRAKAGKRRICCAIGRQDKAKGFDRFVRLYCERPDLREQWLFAVGGTVDPALDRDLQAFEAAGGHAVARFIDHAELLDLYAAADLVWCCYDPDYDQASGIFGRAKQLSIPTVVREGSLIEAYCRDAGLAHLPFDGSPSRFDPAALPTNDDPARAATLAQAEGRESLGRLRAALGLD